MRGNQITRENGYFKLAEIAVMYDFCNLGSCEIGNEGAKHLVKGMWPNLFHINISNHLFIF